MMHITVCMRVLLILQNHLSSSLDKPVLDPLWIKARSINESHYSPVHLDTDVKMLNIAPLSCWVQIILCVRPTSSSTQLRSQHAHPVLMFQLVRVCVCEIRNSLLFALLLHRGGRHFTAHSSYTQCL